MTIPHSNSHKEPSTPASIAHRILEFSKGAAPAVVLLIVVLGAWQVATRVFHTPSWMLPSPREIVRCFTDDWRKWLSNTGVTLLESVLGFLAGSIFGIACGILFAHSRPMEKALYPYVIALKTVPLVALAPLLAIWFRNHFVSDTIMGAVITFFPCVVNTVMGLRSPTPETLELMQSLSATPAQTFRMLRLPAALPGIFSALKISATLSVIGAIVAEMSTQVYGLGMRLQLAVEQTDTATMITAVILSSLAGIVFFRAIVWLEGKLVFWRPPGEDV